MIKQKTNYILLLLFLLINFGYAQRIDSILIKGRILYSETNLPISFAGIFIKSSTKGTISDSLGYFSMNISKDNLEDTLIVSAIGYSTFKNKISDFKNIKKVSIYLNDSIYLLDQVVAIAYDYFETLVWQSRRKGIKTKYLTFSTNDIDNVSNFIKIMRSQFGKSKEKGTLYKWKNATIPNFGKHNKISLKFFECPYCPAETDITVTILIRDDHGKNPLNDNTKREQLENFFQGVLDKTFDMGVDFTQLVKRSKTYYKKNSVEPYSGKCFGYFKNGQIGLKGTIKNGKKVGEWNYWYSNGRKRMLVHYDEIGQKTGNWKYWYDNGQIRLDTHYIKGRMVGKNIWWYDNGQKKKVSLYKNGVFMAKIEWNEKGKIIEKVGNLSN